MNATIESNNSAKTWLDTNLIPLFSIVAAASAGMVGFSAWSTWNVYRNFQAAITTNFKLQDLSGQIVHLDEVLTMSARMAASTGDIKWEERYLANVPPLDKAIAEVLEIAPQYQENSSQTDGANANLIAMEERAFKLVRQQKLDEALNLLLGQEYQAQKTIYSQGIEKTLANIKESVDNQIQTYGRQLSRSAILAGLSFPLLLVSWVIVLSLIGSYISDRNLAQNSLEEFNQDLEKTIAERTAQLTEQEQLIRQESELLQEDIGQLLEVVSIVEEGDFTVQAPVNDRVTGLIFDTLNRLIEELSKVLAQVLNVTDQFGQRTQQLDEVTNQVSTNAEQEVRAVREVLNLINEVGNSALKSGEQIKVSITSLQNLRTAVEQGQKAGQNLTEGIEVLQKGTDQIVQQMKTLGEFVGLTDQFLQEQNQISSMTQVLAMNASLVAARASEQRDPTQFVVVAREFESIANQVSSLAQRTSSGLVNLEQRSSQIHNVVTSIDTNVQNLGGLVRDFTQGVQQSSNVLSNVQQTAEEAVQAGELVAISSQEIINSARSTTKVMGNIAELAEKTRKLTHKNLKRSQQMAALSNELLTTINFFQLPPIYREQPEVIEEPSTIFSVDSQASTSTSLK
jgi:methyl-accepting chemotaxis protein PixJ